MEAYFSFKYNISNSVWFKPFFKTINKDQTGFVSGRFMEEETHI